MVRQSGSRRVLVPPNGFEVIAHKLLIVGELRSARTIALGRPEARGIGSEYFISKRDAAIDHAKLKLRVRDDDAAVLSMFACEQIDAKRQVAQLFCRIAANNTHHLREGNVCVMSAAGLCCRSEYWFRQPVGFAQPGGQLDAAYCLGLLIFLPTRTGKITSRNAFHRKHLRASHEHGASAKLVNKIPQRFWIL